MTNLSLYLVESADMYPVGAALRCDGATTTFSELADKAARFAAYLGDRGLRPGDRVGVMLASTHRSMRCRHALPRSRTVPGPGAASESTLSALSRTNDLARSG
jgi:acyl-CoA synthetase (AMP-forming)/AMP-acid ligase II